MIYQQVRMICSICVVHSRTHLISYDLSPDGGYLGVCLGEMNYPMTLLKTLNIRNTNGSYSPKSPINIMKTCPCMYRDFLSFKSRKFSAENFGYF